MTAEHSSAIGFRYPLLAVVGAGVFAAAPLVTVLAVKLVTAPDVDAPVPALALDVPTEEASGCAASAPVDASEDEMLDVDDMNMHTLAQNARIAPVFVKGRAFGFKLYDLAPDGFFAQAGLKDGDVIRRVNGIATLSPELALQAYARARESDIVVVDFVRDGTAGTLSYRLR